MLQIPAQISSAPAPTLLRVARTEFPILAGAWTGVALVPLVLAAVVLGTTAALTDAIARRSKIR